MWCSLCSVGFAGRSIQFIIIGLHKGIAEILDKADPLLMRS